MSALAPQLINDRIRYRAVGEDGVIVHLDNAEVIVVNEVGLFLVEQLSQPRTVQELVDAIVREFNVKQDIARADVEIYLGELCEQHLIGPAAASEGT